MTAPVPPTTPNPNLPWLTRIEGDIKSFVAHIWAVYGLSSVALLVACVALFRTCKGA